jgi:hypothetical protein
MVDQQFSKLVDLAISVSTMAGVTHRICELLEVLCQFPESEEPQIINLEFTQQLDIRGFEV